MKGRLARVQNWEVVAREARFEAATLADLCFVSLRQLERYFEQQFKRRPKQWLSELRCRTAIHLIATGWSTKAVAYELNFASESHFCHEFKRMMQVPPQHFAPGCGPQMPVSNVTDASEDHARTESTCACPGEASALAVNHSRPLRKTSCLSNNVAF